MSQIATSTVVEDVDSDDASAGNHDGGVAARRAAAVQINIVPFGQLSADHLAWWSQVQRSEPSLSSPFFRPEFAQIIDTLRGGVEVAVVERAGEPIALLPFQRSMRGIGAAVGSPMNDYQGAIVRPGTEWSPQAVVRKAGLMMLCFDHLLDSQQEFAEFQHLAAEAHYVDILGGYEPFIRSRSKNFRKKLKVATRSAEEIGALRLEANPADPEALVKLMEWKIDQCRRTGIPCTFARHWSREILPYILANPTPEFWGTLWVLYVGSQIGALQFTLRTPSVLHAWVCAYNPELGDCSPGFLLDAQMLQVVANEGVSRIDLGKGREAYKTRLSTGFSMLTEGAVPAVTSTGHAYRAMLRARQRLSTTGLKAPLQRVRRWVVSARTRLGLAD